MSQATPLASRKSPHGWRAHWPLSRVAAIVCGMCVLLLLNVLPAVTGALSRGLKLTTSQLGAFASAEVLGICAGSFLAALLLARLNARTLAGVGLALVLGVNLGSYGSSHVEFLTLARSVGGFGTGLVLGACYFIFGLTDSERYMSACQLGQLVLAFVFMLCTGAIEAGLGWPGLFLALALLLLPGVLLVAFLPALRLPQRTSVQGPEMRTPASIAGALGGVVVFFVGVGAVWTFLERIGDASGIAPATVQRCLSICSAFGLAGAVLVVVVGMSVDRMRMLVSSYLLTMAAMAGILSPNPWVYGAAISVFYFCLPVFAAYQFGAIAAADPSGRAAVFASTAGFVGFAVGSVVGGELIEWYGFSGLPWLHLGMMGLGLLSVAWLRRKSG